MNETRRKPTTGRQSPSLFDKWHGIFYMPSRIDEAGHTKAFDYPVAEHWGESQRTKRSLVGFESTSAHTYESEIQRSTTYATPTPLKEGRQTDSQTEEGKVFPELRFYMPDCIYSTPDLSGKYLGPRGLNTSSDHSHLFPLLSYPGCSRGVKPQ